MSKKTLFKIILTFVMVFTMFTGEVLIPRDIGINTVRAAEPEKSISSKSYVITELLWAGDYTISGDETISGPSRTLVGPYGDTNITIEGGKTLTVGGAIKLEDMGDTGCLTEHCSISI